MKSKGNNSNSEVVKTILRIITAPFVSHMNGTVEVPTPNETVKRYPTTFIYDHLQFFNPENIPSIHAVNEMIPYRPNEVVISSPLYRLTQKSDENRKTSPAIKKKNNTSDRAKKGKNKASWIGKIQFKVE
jgi:hypothetical protein